MISAYLHWPTAILLRSRGVRYCTKFAASGPVISTWRSTATSHRIASLTRFQKFWTGSPKSRGIYMWLYTENACAPHLMVASKYGGLRICVPKPKSIRSLIRNSKTPCKSWDKKIFTYYNTAIILGIFCDADTRRAAWFISIPQQINTTIGNYSSLFCHDDLILNTNLKN